MLWIALAAQISMPVAERRPLWELFSYDDVPVKLVGEGHARRVDVRVTFGPDGKFRACQAEFSSGVPQLGVYTCGLIRQRAKFRPAKWFDGSPAYGVFRTAVSWSVDADRPQGSADLELTVTQLPPGVKSPATAYLMFAVDERGRASSCTDEYPAPASRVSLTPNLIQIACDQLMKTYTPVPATDDVGKAVRSIQDATVRFVVGR